MYHYGNMSLSIVQTDVWQSFDTRDNILRGIGFAGHFLANETSTEMDGVGLFGDAGHRFRVVDRENLTKRSLANYTRIQNPEAISS